MKSREGCARVDVLINNAGLWHPQRTLCPRRHRRHARGSITCAVSAGPTCMRADRCAKRRARIVNVSLRLAEKLTAFNFEDPQHEEIRLFCLCADQARQHAVFRRAGRQAVRHRNRQQRAASWRWVSDICVKNRSCASLAESPRPLFDTPQSASLTSIHVATAQTLSGTSGVISKSESRQAIAADRRCGSTTAAGKLSAPAHRTPYRFLNPLA